MFAQLGSIVFQGLIGFNDLSFNGDESVYAEFALINKKPRLQKTGDTLQEINFDIKFHAEFCNPAKQLAALKLAKDNGNVLPLLMGNGIYVGDYVITTMPYTVDDAFPDGTILQATVSVTIKEYIAYNKLEQKEQEARKNAIAVGDKKPIITRPAQPVTLDTAIASKTTEVKQQAGKVDNSVNEIENNPSNIQAIGKHLTDACSKAENSISDINNQLDSASELENKYTGLREVSESAATAFVAIKDLYPYDNLSDLKSSNQYLQNIMRTFNRATTPLFTDIIIRK